MLYVKKWRDTEESHFWIQMQKLAKVLCSPVFVDDLILMDRQIFQLNRSRAQNFQRVNLDSKL